MPSSKSVSGKGQCPPWESVHSAIRECRYVKHDGTTRVPKGINSVWKNDQKQCYDPVSRLMGTEKEIKDMIQQLFEKEDADMSMEKKFKKNISNRLITFANHTTTMAEKLEEECENYKNCKKEETHESMYSLEEIHRMMKEYSKLKSTKSSKTKSSKKKSDKTSNLKTRFESMGSGFYLNVCKYKPNEKTGASITKTIPASAADENGTSKTSKRISHMAPNIIGDKNAKKSYKCAVEEIYGEEKAKKVYEDFLKQCKKTGGKKKTKKSSSKSRSKSPRSRSKSPSSKKKTATKTKSPKSPSSKKKTATKSPKSPSSKKKTTTKSPKSPSSKKKTATKSPKSPSSKKKTATKSPKSPSSRSKSPGAKTGRRKKSVTSPTSPSRSGKNPRKRDD